MSEWISIDERLPEKSCIIDVKNDRDELNTCYFHADNMGRMNWYYPRGMNLKFQVKKTGKFLDDVTHWKEREKLTPKCLDCGRVVNTVRLEEEKDEV